MSRVEAQAAALFRLHPRHGLIFVFYLHSPELDSDAGQIKDDDIAVAAIFALSGWVMPSGVTEVSMSIITTNASSSILQKRVVREP
jgi:hypothetical protein